MGANYLEDLDHHFVDIYEAARAKVLERQKQKALIVIDDDQLLLYRGGHPVETFTGLRPPLYVKMKTLGHMPLAVYCLLHDEAGQTLSTHARAAIAGYRATIESAAGVLDTRDDAERGLLPGPSKIRDKVLGILDRALATGRITEKELSAFASDFHHDIEPVLAAAARVQLDACQEHVAEIQRNRLSPDQLKELRVLVLGPYMARQGQNFLQYFSQLLDTPMHGDKRLVYFEGEDLNAAFARLGTAMLDAEASEAIFGNTERLHRDVLADATTKFLRQSDEGSTPGASRPSCSNSFLSRLPNCRRHPAPPRTR